MKPCIVEFTYPRGLGKVISGVTQYQRRTANPSLRTLRESLGDHYGPRHRYRHVLTLCMHNHMRIPAPSCCRSNVPIVDARLRRSAATWHPSRPTRAGQYLSPQLYSDRLDVLFNANQLLATITPLDSNRLGLDFFTRKPANIYRLERLNDAQIRCVTCGFTAHI